MAHRRKLATLAIFSYSKHPKIISRDSRDTRAALNRVHDQPWSFIGPYRVFLKGPCDFRDSARLFIPFLKNIMEHVYDHCYTSPRLREPSWTLKDPQMDSKIDPARRGPLPNKGPPGLSMVQNDNFFIGLKTMDKLNNTTWFEVNRTYGCRSIII